MNMQEKIKNFAIYLQSYQTITFFELRSLFGSSLFAVVIFILALPLLLFSTQWVTLPLSSVIICCAIWYFFDTNIWMPDFVKKVTLSQDTARKLSVWLERLTDKSLSPAWNYFKQANIVVIA